MGAQCATRVAPELPAERDTGRRNTTMGAEGGEWRSQPAPLYMGGLSALERAGRPRAI